jgi:Domain of unknown function (DUF4801)
MLVDELSLNCVFCLLTSFVCCCHLLGCQPTCQCRPVTCDPLKIYSEDDESSPPPLPARIVGVTCNEDFCRLGCVCVSIHRPGLAKRREHCGRVECMLGCCCTLQRARLRSGRMTLYDGRTKIDDYDSILPHITSTSHSQDSKSDVDDQSKNDCQNANGTVRKSIKFQPNFSSYEKMKSLIYFDPAIWLKDDVRSRKRKVG